MLPLARLGPQVPSKTTLKFFLSFILICAYFHVGPWLLYSCQIDLDSVDDSSVVCINTRSTPLNLHHYYRHIRIIKEKNIKYLPKLGPIESMKDSNIKYQKVTHNGSSLPFISRLTSCAVPPPDDRGPPLGRPRLRKYSFLRLTVYPLLYDFRWFLGFSTCIDTLSHSTRSGSRELIQSHSSTSKVQSRGVGTAT